MSHARRRPLVLVLAGGALLALADAMGDIVAPWLALEVGGPALAGLVSAVALAPAIPASLIGGWLADRCSARPVFVLGAAAVALSALVLATASAGGWIEPALLLAVIALASGLDEPAMTMREARLPALAAMAQRPLHRVNTADDLLMTAAVVIGPAIAAAAGLPAALLAIAVLGAAAGLLLAWAPALRPLAARGSQKARLLDGLRALWAEPALRALALGAAAAIAIFVSAEAVLLPVLIRARGGAIGDLVHFILPASAAAAATALLYAWKGAHWPATALMRIGLLGLGIGLLGLAAVHALTPELSKPALIATGVVIGAAFGPVSPAATTALQTMPDPSRRGAVIGAATAVALAAAPLASLIAGFALAAAPALLCLAVAGAAAVIAAAAAGRTDDGDDA